MNYPPWSMFVIAGVFLILFGVAAVATAIYVDRNCKSKAARKPEKVPKCACE